jgi:tetratricopeptide (TPR) repeat protein
MKSKLWLMAVCSTLLGTAAWAQHAPATTGIAPDQQKRLDVMKAKGPDASLTILPVRLRGKPWDRETELVGVLLEQQGLKNIELGKTPFTPAETNLESLAAAVGAFVKTNPITTGYALYAEYNGDRQTGLNELRAVVVDQTGAVIWTDRLTMQDEALKKIEDRDPMTLSVLLVERLSPQLGLNDQTAKAAKPGKLAAIMDQRSGEPPENEQVAIGQYISLVKLNRTNDGAKVLDNWVAAKPDDPRRWFCKAMAEAQTDRPEAALKSFEKLTELQPNESGGWGGKGEMLVALKRDDEALKAYDKAITLSPKHEAAWSGRGGVLLRLGKYDEAIKSLDKAIELRPQWEEPWYGRACAYSLKGDKAKAIADLKKALELNPSLKSNASTEGDFKSLRNDPDFKKLSE